MERSSRGRGGVRRGGAARGGHRPTSPRAEIRTSASSVGSGFQQRAPSPQTVQAPSNVPLHAGPRLQSSSPRISFRQAAGSPALPQRVPALSATSAQSASSSSDPAVDPVSEKVEKMSLSTPVPSSSELFHQPQRPGFGTVGDKCVVLANHFKVEVPSDVVIYHYDVSMTPEVKSVGRMRKVISELVTSYRLSHLGDRLPVYDGRKSLFSFGKLPFSSNQFEVKFFDDDGTSFKRERCFKVSIKFASTMEVHHLMQFLNGQQRDLPQELVQALDIVLRETPSEVLLPLGRSFFSRAYGAVSLGEGAECWRGYFQSVRPTQMGLSLNIGAHYYHHQGGRNTVRHHPHATICRKHPRN